MKIVLTGSLGHISLTLTKELVQKGHNVTVISSKAERQKDIEALGAKAAIGQVEDADFLTSTFRGADAVYTMIPPGNYFNTEFDIMAHCKKLANNFSQAIQKSGVKRVVHLSSIGAHMDKGSGLILFHRAVEDELDKLPDVGITFMRPVGFYYNLYSFVPLIKRDGLIASNFGGDKMLIWVSPIDIAAAIAEEIVKPLTGRKVIYVASDLLTGNETARILGEAIGKPDLKWFVIPDEQAKAGLIAAGMNPEIAAGMVEMYAAQQNGSLTEDYYRHPPKALGKIKIKDFAKEFANAFK
jgi:uncharacterized protein YbjT (DUF2867 family)